MYCNDKHLLRNLWIHCSVVWSWYWRWPKGQLHSLLEVHIYEYFAWQVLVQKLGSESNVEESIKRTENKEQSLEALSLTHAPQCPENNLHDIAWRQHRAVVPDLRICPCAPGPPIRWSPWQCGRRASEPPPLSCRLSKSCDWGTIFWGAEWIWNGVMPFTW